MDERSLSRRHFFFGTLLAGAVPIGGFGSVPSLTQLGYKSPNQKLNIAAIGAGGQAASDIRACSQTENIVALADVDDERAAATFNKFPQATKYRDFRAMLDKENANIDAVIVAIPDHMHAAAAIPAMQLGKHVYVEKPLAHTVWECRQLADAAARYKVATQMGNQGYSYEGTRQCAEMIWNGEIGNVTEVHAWTNRPAWPQGITEPPRPAEVPSTLDWNLWLGTAQDRPFSKDYLPFIWRGFYDFGLGALGDMACHILGAPNLALRLTAPVAVECLDVQNSSELYFPAKSVVRFEFPERPNMPAVKIYWYDAMREDQPDFPAAPKNEILGDLPRNRRPDNAVQLQPPEHQIEGGVFTDQFFHPKDLPKTAQAAPARTPTTRDGAEWMKLISTGTNGSLFIGDKGMITTGTYGEWTRLIPVDRMRDYQFPPEVLTRSPEHHQDWIRACKGGEPGCSNFAVAAPFTEWIALGAIAIRLKTRLEWDPANMRITNNEAANALLKPYIKPGWYIS